MSHTLEVYLLLFVDSFVASLVLPLSRLTAFNIMCCFGGEYGAAISVTIGAVGASLGGLVNWFLGRLVRLARIGYQKPKLTPELNSYFCALLLLLLGAISWVHIVGSLINVICGYNKVKLTYTFFAVFLSYLGYLIYQLTYSDCLLLG